MSTLGPNRAQYIGGISVSAPMWFYALKSPEEMARLRGELDREAARIGGRIRSYDPQGSRGRDAGGRTIYDTLAPVREFVFWVVAL